jgi:hypothetical protein
VNWPSATPKPHISAALQHLRFGIAAAAIVLALSLVGQVLVWSFVHFTEVRVVQLENEPAEPNLDVVRRAQPSTNTVGTISGVSRGASVGASGNKDVQAQAAQTPAQPEPAQPEGVDPNVVESASARQLRHTAALVQTTGVISAVLLLVLMFQGVVVAGGGAVPGVEMAVTATSWAILIALICIPLGNVLPATPFQGVFSGYDTIVAQSEAYRLSRDGAPGVFGLYAMNVALPVLLLIGLAAAVLRFRAGIERGVIATSVSEAHERLEREIRSRKNLGEMANSRAMGALNSAVVDPLTGMPVGEPPQPHQPAMHPSSSSTPGTQAKPILDPTFGSYGRPL